MNVPTITMPRGDARAKLREYRAALHRKADAEYMDAVAALEQMEKGLPVIRLTEAFRVAPRDAKGRPRLALGRADRKQVEYRQQYNETRAAFNTRIAQGWRQPRGNDGWMLNLAVDVGTLPPRPPDAMGWNAVRGYALVPIVPPQVHGRFDLSKHFILWEVEAWADQMIGARPDIDPLLLRRVSADLYAVVAEWDLSPLEQAIMAGRALT